MSSKMKKILAAFLAVSIMFGMTACSQRGEESSSEVEVSTSSEVEEESSSSKEESSSSEVEKEPVSSIIPTENRDSYDALVGDVADLKAWLQIPGTDLNEAVVQTDNNNTYYRANIYRQEAFEGCLYFDYECDLGTGTAADMPQNAIIYGHNLGEPMGVKDDPNGVSFAQLMHFTDIDFATKTPYVYLTTESGDLVYEVFATSYTESQMKPVLYLYPEYTDDNFNTLMADIKDRSLYDYNVEVTPDDKILILSTCTYKYGTYSENDNQRFIVCARLVSDDEEIKEVADLQANPDPKQPTF